MTLINEDVYQISRRWLEKMAEFGHLKCQKWTLLLYLRGFPNFPDFYFCPIWAVKKCYRVVFYFIDEMMSKHVSYHRNQKF